MALIAVARFWTISSNGLFSTAAWTGLDFNTDTHLIEPSQGGYTMALLDPRPTNYTSPVGAYLWFECAVDYTQTKWFYGGGNAVTVETIANSTECGWTPPVVTGPTCDLALTASATGDVITAVTSGAHGVVAYSIDGGITRQSSPEFKDVAPGSYVVTAYDAGATNCSRTATVFVVATPPSLSPVPGALPAVAFAGNPIALVGQATRPGRALLLELFVESAHGSLNYQRLVQRLRPTGLTGSTVLELQKELAAALVPDRPVLGRPPGLRRLTAGIRRYYAALAEIQPGTGRPGPFVFEAPRTVLLGGLSWPAARAGDFFVPVPARFLTWRPRVVQYVGPDHVLLHSALIDPVQREVRASVKCFALGSNAPFQVLSYALAIPLSGAAAADGGGAANTLDTVTPWLVEAQVLVSVLPAETCRVSMVLTDALGVPLTEERLFRLDTSKRRRQFVFLNSLGVWDTLSCFGPRSSKTSVERTVATTLAPPDYDPQGGTDAVVDVATDERITISTGMVSPDELHWLRELHTSRDVYEVAGPQLRKIRLTTKDFTNYQDDAGSDGFSFEYQYCFATTSYAPHDWI